MDHNPTCFANHMGLWAIEPTWLNQALAAIKGSTWNVQVDARAGRDGGPLFTMAAEGVAVIPLAGPMMKGSSKFGGTSTLLTRRAIRDANADERVREIILHVDSPGGHVAGTAELADAVRDSGKPITASVSDLAASAAYWVASQAWGGVYANRMAEIGSIGTIALLADTSGAAALEGVEVHVITTAPYKAVGAPGVPVEDAHLAYLTERVEAMNDHFQAAITAGRDLAGPDLERVSDGRVWGAQEAVGLGLIDGVQSFEATVAAVADRVRSEDRAAARFASLKADVRRSELQARTRRQK